MNSNRLASLDLRYDLMEVIDENKVTDQAEVYQAAERIAPTVECDREDGHIPVKKAGDGDRLIDGRRGEDGSYPRINWVMGDDSYFTEFGGWEIPTDNIRDYEVRQFVNLEEYNAQILRNTAVIGAEYRVSKEANDLNNYDNDHKKTITLAADNVITGTNLLELGVTAAEALFPDWKTDVSHLTAIIGVDAIRTILYNLEDLKTSQVCTAPMETMPWKARLEILKAYLGVKDIIPVSGAYNSSHLEQSAVFGKLWSQTQIIYALTSSGGRWDRSYMRQPRYTKPLGGRPYIIESYDEPQNDRSVIRYKESFGLKANFDMAYVVEGIFATGV